MATLRDRLFTPRGAKALMSPWRLLTGVIAGAVAAVLGAPLGVAALIAVGVYAATVLTALAPRRTAPRIDPFTLSEPWRRYVQRAQSARRRFDGVLLNTNAGPIKERLAGIGERLDDGVRQCWLIARRGDDLDAAVTRIDPVAARSRLARLRSAAAVADEGDVIASLEAQLASADRMKTTSAQAASRLALMTTRLDELVARAAEVGVGVGDDAAFGSDVDELVTELEALRLALDETERASASGGGAAPQVSFEASPEPPPPAPAADDDAQHRGEGTAGGETHAS